MFHGAVLPTALRCYRDSVSPLLGSRGLIPISQIREFEGDSAALDIQPPLPNPEGKAGTHTLALSLAQGLGLEAL